MNKFIFLICCLVVSLAQAGQVTLNIKNASLPDAIRFIASAADTNVIVDAAVMGTVSLALKNASAESALSSILESHGLAILKMGNIWYVAEKNKLIKDREEEVKWQETLISAAPLITHIQKIRYAKADDIAQLIRNQQTAFISKRGKVHVDGRTNTLLIQDVAEQITLLKKLIASLDVPVKQILIEAKLASVDADYEQEVGVDFTVESTAQEAGMAALPHAVSASGKYSIAVAKLANGSLLDVKLSALEESGHARLISAPRLFTANQQSAYIESGEEVPYQEVSESGGTAVTFKKAVLGLKVTPQILPGNRVLLQLKINQDRPGVRMVQGVPAISTRQMLTSVLVKNGETVVLGGIYEMNEEDGQKGLPFLSRIPFLGVLFRTQTARHSKRELLVFVTPRIIS